MEAKGPGEKLQETPTQASPSAAESGYVATGPPVSEGENLQEGLKSCKRVAVWLCVHRAGIGIFTKETLFLFRKHRLRSRPLTPPPL